MSDWNERYHELLDEVQRLQAWKAEAIVVLDGWDEVFDRCAFPATIGDLKSAAVGSFIDGLRARIARQQDSLDAAAEVTAAMGRRAAALEAEVLRKGQLIADFGKALEVPSTTPAERALIDAALAYHRRPATQQPAITLNQLHDACDAVQAERGER